MTGFVYGNVWQTLSEYNFDIDLKSLRDLTCTICGKLLINAHQGPCGCRYCLNCLSDYLNSGQQFCRGTADDCRLQPMSINSNVHTDNAANRAISSLVVKCPESLCAFSAELRSIDEHIKSHRLLCPFTDVGCSHSRMDADTMVAHLSDESYSHATLLMDCVQNSRNEMAALRERVDVKDVQLGQQLQQRLETVEQIQTTMNMQLQCCVTADDDLRADVDVSISRVETITQQMESQSAVVQRMERQIDEVHIAHTMQLSKLELSLADIKECGRPPTGVDRPMETAARQSQQQSPFMSLPPTRSASFVQQPQQFSLSGRPIARARARPVGCVMNDSVQLNHGSTSSSMDTVAAIEVLRQELRRANEAVALLTDEMAAVKLEVNSNEELIIQFVTTVEEMKKENQRMAENIDEKVARWGRLVRQLQARQEDLSQQLRQQMEQQQQLQQTVRESAPPPPPTAAILDCPSRAQPSLSPFHWTIDDFHAHRARARAGTASFINSGPFYSHEGGYKLCLSLFPDGIGAGKRRYVTVGCRLMAGDHDETLAWPMRHAVTVSVVDQKFGLARISHRFQHDSVSATIRHRLGRPRVGSMNDGIGATRFVSWNKLCNDARLFADDTIVLRCVVDEL